jgi:hypothetical protein
MQVMTSKEEQERNEEQEKQQLLKDLREWCPNVAKSIDRAVVDVLWRHCYCDLPSLSTASRQSLREAGVPFALLDAILHAQSQGEEPALAQRGEHNQVHMAAAFQMLF